VVGKNRSNGDNVVWPSQKPFRCGRFVTECSCIESIVENIKEIINQSVWSDVFTSSFLKIEKHDRCLISKK